MRTRHGLLIAVAFAIRLGYVTGLPQIPVQADARDYDQLARGVVEGLGLVNAQGEPETLRAPLYPLLVAGVYRLGGPDPQEVRFVQVLLGALVPLVVLCIGLGCFSPFVAWSAAVLCALYPALIAYTGALLTETSACLLVSLVALCAIWSARHGGGWRYAMTGVLLGLGALCRAEMMALAASFVVFLLLPSRRRPPPHGRAWRHATALLAGFLVTLAPWTVRNYVVLNAFVPLTTDGWRTLWLSSYPEGWLEWKQEEPLLSIEAGAKGPLDRARRYREAALRNLRSHPTAYLRLAVRRVPLLYVGGHSNLIAGLEGRTVDSTGIVFVLKVGLLILNSLIVALGAVGLWLCRGRWEEIAPLYLIVLIPTTVYILLIAFPRYHVSFLPVLFLFAAEACGRLASDLRSAKRSHA